MKLAKIALTPPIAAISIFAFFALTAHADFQNLLTVAKTQGTPTITGNNVWSSKFANLFNGVATAVNDNERWMTGNPADAAGIGWTSISFPAACTSARSLYLKQYRLYQVQSVWGSNLKAPTGWNLYGKTKDDGEWELIDSPVISADSPDHWLYFDDSKYGFEVQNCTYPQASKNEKHYITLDVPIEKQKQYVAIKFEPTKNYLTDHADSYKETWFFSVEELELYGDDVAPILDDGHLSVEGDPSEVGVVTPAYGETTGHTSGQQIQFSAPEFVAVDSDNRWTCAGYKVQKAGVTVLEDTTHEFDYVHDGAASVIWQWARQFHVSAAIGADQGTVAVSADWVTEGDEVTVTATPADGLIFAGWTGAPRGHESDNPLTVAVGEPLALTAVCMMPEAHTAALSVEGYSGGATLQNFPVLVRISPAKINGFSYLQCAEGGLDVYFTSPDGATVYPHEIDTWDKNGTSLVWVKLPALAQGAAFQFHWGDPSAKPVAAMSPMWQGIGADAAGNYVGVYHMNGASGADEPDSARLDPSVDLTARCDSGGNAVQPIGTVAGMVGGARDLNATFAAGGNFFRIPSRYAVYHGGPLTYSFWVNEHSVNGSTWHFFFKQVGGLALKGLGVKGTDKNRAYWYPNGSSGINCETGIKNEGWSHILVTVGADGKSSAFYLDGQLIGTSTASALSDKDADFLLGTDAPTATTMGARVDEFRTLGGLEISADWAKAEYEMVANELFVTEAKSVWSNMAGGDFLEGANWSTGSMPPANDPAVFRDSETYTVTFSEALSRANALGVTKASGTTTFDTTGASWTLPAAASYLTKQDHPIVFNNGVGNAFVVDQGETATGVLKSEGGAFGFTGGAQPKTFFSSGAVNFYDPDGTAPTEMNMVIPNADIDAETEFAGGTSRLPDVQIAPAKTRTVDALRFTGGTHDIFGLVSVANRMALGNVALLEVSGTDTVVSMKGGYDGLGSGSGEGNYASFHSDALVVKDGATLNVGGYRFRTFAADFRLEVLNGATLNVDSEYFSLGTIYDTATPEQGSCANYNTNRVTVADATLAFGPTVKRAWFGSYDPWKNSKSYTILAATNAVLSSAGEIRLNEGTYELKDCTGDIRSLIANSRHADLVIDGGALNFTNNLCMNSSRQSSLTNAVTFKAGDHIAKQIIVSQNDQGGSAAGILNVEGGTVTVTSSLIMSGGTGATSILNLSGGELVASDAFSMIGWGSGKAFLNLTGGTFKLGAIPGSGAEVVILGDGGALETTKDNTNIAPHQNSYDYRLGPNGLVIRTDYLNTTCSALFKDVEGEEGLLAKEGSGTLTLTATAFDFSAAEVRAGVLKFPATATGVDFPATTVAGGTLDLSGSNGKPVFKSLTLGDGTVVGELKIDNASEFVLDDFTPVSAKITLSEPAVDGTYGAFKVKGDQTDKLELWEQTITDLPEGKQHVYTATYDEGADVTTFAITVEDKKAASGTAHWTGAADADWGNAGNWTDDAAVPTKETTAFFESDSAPKNVEVGSGAVAAGLHLSGYPGYVLGGDGALTLSDGVAGAIEVTAADHAVNVPVAVKSTMPVTVAEGASLALNGSVTQDGLVKRGAGTLTLGAANDLRYGLRVEEGTLAATTADAFADKPLVFTGASKFAYAGAAAETSEPLQIEADEAGAAVEFETAGDLAFDGIVNTTGSIVKSGAGTLTLKLDKDSTLFKKDEKVTVNAGTLEIEVPSGVVTVPAGKTDRAGSYVVSNGAFVVSGAGNFRERKASVNSYPNVEDAEASVRLVVDGARVDVENVRLGASGAAYDGQSSGLYLTNATLTVWNDIYFFGYSNLVHKIIAKDSAVSASILYPQSGWFEMDFDNSTLGGNRYLFNGNSSMDALFHNGGAYGLPGIEFTGSRAVSSFGGLRFRFDNGRITAGASFKWIGEDNLIETRAGGLMIAAGENNVAFSQPVEGVGGVVKTGAGTLRFDRAAYTGFDNKSHDFDSPVTMAYLGKTEIREGALKVTNGVVRAGMEVSFAVGTTLDLSSSEVAFGSVAGSPTVVNGTLAADLVVSNGDLMAFGDTAKVKNAPFRLTYAYSAEDVAAKTEILPRVDFGANPPTGRVIVDLGNGERSDLPLVLEPGQSISGVIATYTGADPDVSGWRVKGRGGIGVRGAITAANGEIRLTLTPGTGLQILVR